MLEAYVSMRRDCEGALVFLKKLMKCYGQPHVIVPDRLRSYCAAMKVIGNEASRETGRGLNNRCENSHLSLPR